MVQLYLTRWVLSVHDPLGSDPSYMRLSLLSLFLMLSAHAYNFIGKEFRNESWLTLVQSLESSMDHGTWVFSPTTARGATAGSTWLTRITRLHTCFVPAFLRYCTSMWSILLHLGPTSTSSKRVDGLPRIAFITAFQALSTSGSPSSSTRSIASRDFSRVHYDYPAYPQDVST